MSDWLHSSPLPPAWPKDRYEVRFTRPAPDFTSVDRYHYAKNAHEAVSQLQEAGNVTQIQVIRLEDRVVLFDLAAGIDAPFEAW
jgi:hypothetical protein